MDDETRILCVDDEKNVLKALTRLFMDEEFEVFTASSGEEGLKILSEDIEVKVIISDYRMPQMNGVEFLKEVCARRPETIRIVLSGYADTASIVSAINEGQIYKFIPKPWNDDELKITIRNAVHVFDLNKKNVELTSELKESNEELRLLNENLEGLVQDRANELIFQNKILVRSQNILDSLPIGVLGLDEGEEIVQCNAKCDEILTQAGGLIGRKVREILPREVTDALAEIREGNSSSEWIVITDTNYRVRSAPVVSAEGQQGFVLVFDYQ